LTAARQAHPVTATSVTAQIGQPLDIHGHLAPTITFNDILVLKDLPDPVDVVTIQIVTVHGVRKIHLIENLACGGQTYTVDIG
jgi:hypothetical protein